MQTSGLANWTGERISSHGTMPYKMPRDGDASTTGVDRRPTPAGISAPPDNSLFALWKVRYEVSGRTIRHWYRRIDPPHSTVCQAECEIRVFSGPHAVNKLLEQGLRQKKTKRLRVSLWVSSPREHRQNGKALLAQAIPETVREFL
jgi:hypothetical protein